MKHLLFVYQSASEDTLELEEAFAQAKAAHLDPLPVQERAGKCRQFVVWCGSGTFPRAFKLWLTDYSSVEWLEVQLRPDGPQIYDDSEAVTRV